MSAIDHLQATHAADNILHSDNEKARWFGIIAPTQFEASGTSLRRRPALLGGLFVVQARGNPPFSGAAASCLNTASIFSDSGNSPKMLRSD